MSRSTYIYLAIKDGATIAAFTVKWEMAKWWRQYTEYHDGNIEFYRMRDNGPVLMSETRHEFPMTPIGIDEVEKNFLDHFG